MNYDNIVLLLLCVGAVQLVAYVQRNRGNASLVWEGFVITTLYIAAKLRMQNPELSLLDTVTVIIMTFETWIRSL